MAKVTLVFEDKTDENGKEGLHMTAPELSTIIQEQSQADHKYTASVIAALTVVRMMEMHALQPQMGVWCQDLIQEMKMTEARNNAVNAAKAPKPSIIMPGNDS